MATLFRQYFKIHNLNLIGFEFINFIYEDYAFTMFVTCLLVSQLHILKT